MKMIQVLGSGCTNCTKTVDLIKQEANQLGVAVQVDKVTDIQALLTYGVMSTPGVVVDEVLVHSGSVPSAEVIASWFE